MRFPASAAQYLLQKVSFMGLSCCFLFSHLLSADLYTGMIDLGKGNNYLLLKK